MDLEEGLGARGAGVEALRSHVKYSPPKDENTNLARELLEAFKRHERRTLLVDTRTGREWTGGRLLEHCGRLASALIRQVRLEPNEVVMTICDHSDEEIAMALAVMLAGGAIHGTTPSDGLEELKTLCTIVKPDVFVVSSAYYERALALRQQVAAGARIVLLDKPQTNGHSKGAQTNGHSCGEQMSNGHRLGQQQGSSGSHENLSDPKESSKWRELGDKQQQAKQQDEAMKKCPAKERVFNVQDLIQTPPDWPLVESTVHERIQARKHILTYMLTSGSTGRPKVVPSTHEELVHGLYSMISACQNELQLPACRDDNNNLLEGRRMGPLMPLGPDDVVAGDLPLDHGAGFNTMLLALWLGAKVIVMPSYDVDAFWQAVSDYQVTFSISSTTFTYKLFSRLKALSEPGGEKWPGWKLDSFRYIACCGAKLAFIDLVREVQRKQAQICVTQAYGCTEIGFISMVHPDEARDHLHSTGFLFPGLEARLVDRDHPNQLICPPLAGPQANRGAAARGELLVWARSKFKGYRCEPAAGLDPGALFADCHDAQARFYRTGDQAHLDAQGRLHIHGRFKDTLFLMEDWKILPAELEDVVNEHPLVEMSAVVGVPDPQLPGCHAPKAFVKLIGRDSPEARQLAARQDDSSRELIERLEQRDLHFLSGHIYEFVAARTAKPKHLKGGVRILDEFPRVGLLNKVDRKQLKLIH